jgi:hypothetical protein
MSIKQELERAETNALLQLLGTGVGSREERRAVYNEQTARAQQERTNICIMAGTFLDQMPRQSASIALIVRIALYNPQALDELL